MAIAKIPTDRRFLNLEQHTYGRLKVISFAGDRKWNCVCECGVSRVVFASNLRRGTTQSCGCLSVEAKTTRATKHGGRHTPEYNIWILMRKRCENTNDARYSDYGGRGITVCERWKLFVNFIADMGPRPSRMHSIDRKNNNGNYGPDNCRWATHIEQANNSRVNRVIEHNGLSLTAAQWERETKIKSGTIRARLAAGWDIARALETPCSRKA